jgi:hypothetical protein
MRKHPRETLAGFLLLAVGFLGPVFVPGLFISRVPDLAEWVLIIVLPLLGSLALRSIIYGASTRHMVNVLRA